MRAGGGLIALDAALVIAFAAAGRRSHDEGTAVAGVLEVAAPLLLALAAGWLASRAWRTPATLRTGAVVWAVTVVGGLALRSTAFDRGIAPAFIAVTALSLGVLLLGWRAAARLVLACRAPA